MARVLIVGAGAAGLMAAGAAVRQGHQVTVLEHTEKPGQKILVTGKGRCNVTNDCPAEEFLRHVRTNPRFLYSSLGAFPPAKTMELFEALGVELKVERGRRVFPVSDKAEEIRQALLRYAQDAEIVYDGAKKLLLEELPPEPEAAPAVPENPRHPKKKKAGPALRCVGVRGTSGKEYRADAVLVATGGVSYPTTGSTGDGYKLAQQAGHTLIEPVPSLVSLVSHDADCKKITSVSVKAGQYSNIFKKPALCPAGKVYIVVESGDKGKGKQNADYTIGVSDNLFQPATANNDFISAQSVLLDVNGRGLFSSGWVGYGDKVDYYKFTSALNGAVEIGITEVESKLKVTLFDTTGKKLASKTIKGVSDAKYATADIFGKDVLLKAGQDYYIAVESGDKGKGYQNSFYNLSINESYAPASRGNNIKENAMALTAGQTTSDWVGYNEPSDFYKITLDKESYLDLNFNFSGKVTLKMTSEYGGKSGNVSLVRTDSGYSSKSALAAGEYFVEIRATSPNNVNSWSNSYNLAYSTR